MCHSTFDLQELEIVCYFFMKGWTLLENRSLMTGDCVASPIGRQAIETLVVRRLSEVGPEALPLPAEAVRPPKCLSWTPMRVLRTATVWCCGLTCLLSRQNFISPLPLVLHRFRP